MPSTLYAVALPWLILSHGGSAQDLGIVLSAYGIPRVVCTLAGGWLSDHIRPRLVMLIADSLRALLVASLAALALGGQPTILELCSVAVPLGALGGAFTPAAMSILPETLSADDLPAGNALNLSGIYAASLTGAALAGTVIATFRVGAGLAMDAATFVVSALSLALMRPTGKENASPRERATRAGHGTSSGEEDGGKGSVLEDQGTSRLIRTILIVAVIAGFCWGGLLEVALPALVHGPLHGSAGDYGAILAACSAGLLIGGLLAGVLGRLKHKGLLMVGNGLLMAGAITVVPVGGVSGAMIGMLVAGLANSVTNVLLVTAIQVRVPSHRLGRVMGLLVFASLGTHPLSAAITGILSSHAGPAILFPLSGLLLALVMVFAMTQRVTRKV
jgi:predicted MFS family arabinose efflux permease